MAEQHIQLMKGLGYTQEQIDAVEGLTAETLKEWKPDDLIAAAQTSIKSVLSNDAEFLKSIPKEKISPDILKEIEKGQYARFQNELEEVAIKKLGLDPTDLSAEDKKSIKGYVEKIATTYLTKKGNVEGLQKMQQELIEARKGLEDLKTQSETALTTALEKANGDNTAKLIRTLTRIELKDIDGVDLSVGEKLITDPVLSELNSKYSVILDANDNLVLKQKADKNLDVVDAKGKVKTFAEALKEVVLEHKLGVVKKDDGKDGKTRKVVIGGGDGEEETFELPTHIANKAAQIKDDK